MLLSHLCHCVCPNWVIIIEMTRKLNKIEISWELAHNAFHCFKFWKVSAPAKVLISLFFLVLWLHFGIEWEWVSREPAKWDSAPTHSCSIDIAWDSHEFHLFKKKIPFKAKDNRCSLEFSLNLCQLSKTCLSAPKPSIFRAKIERTMIFTPFDTRIRYFARDKIWC